MELSTKYDPSQKEEKWYSYWIGHKLFRSKPDPEKTPYTIVIPPPNVTGVLHMGHMLNNTIQDVLIRHARMQGKEALWVPGMDHASIATEAKVVKMLKEQGIEKDQISREEFLEHAWAWKEKYGGIILQQLKKLGASCDWDRARFTMEEALSKQVIKAFVQWYERGYVYRDYRMGNWDPAGQTALADDEVIYKDVQANLYYVNYTIVGEESEYVTIATTRPETIMADAAICVNPEDERFRHLIGKEAKVPLTERTVPIIGDDYVAMDFGTGCLKVTPAHDANDYEIGKRHNLKIIDILTPTGKLNEKAVVFVGEDRAKARKLVAKELEAQGLLAKTEQYTHNVGFSERTDAAVEPRLSMQWYVSMKELCKPALENVMSDRIQLHPPKFKNTYKHWMENVRDWCISRQLWWGHRIPAWYLPNDEIVVAETEEEALKKAQAIDSSLNLEDLRQDPDVLDTWFSSAAWPFSVFDGLNDPENEELKYYYPTSTLVTGPDILFFWVARMIIYGYDFMGEAPFKDVYLTGIIRDNKRRKMSKSLGNSPDALELIRQFGADGVRSGLLFSSPAGNDLLFDEKLCEQGRNFSNKIWNAFRLVKGWETKEEASNSSNQKAIEWMEAKFNKALEEIEGAFDKYRISDALMAMYKLIWNDFCSWYLEIVKPAYGEPIDLAAYKATIDFFERLMRMLHPFMPFITEEVWQHIAERKDGESICVSPYPEKKGYNQELLDQAETVFSAITFIRNTRNEKGLSPKVSLDLHINTPNPEIFQEFEGIVEKMANIEQLVFAKEKPEGAVTMVVKSHEINIPLADHIDLDEERDNLEKELARMRGFLVGVNKKLNNKRFVNNAPKAVVAKEKQKQEDAENKIRLLEETLQGMK